MLPFWLGSCQRKKTEDPAPEPVLTGSWKADSLHYTNYSLAGGVTGRGTLLTSPGTGLTMDATTLTDAGSLGPASTYTYARQDNALTLTAPTAPQRTLTIEALTDHQLRLSYEQPVGIVAPTGRMKTEVFYSR